MIKTTLPTDSAERKNLPALSGALKYAPAAFMLMAETSKLGNDKHNPGEPLHHARGKSMDHGDCMVRHTMDVEDIKAALERRGACPLPDDERQQLRLELGQLMWRTALYVQEAAEKYLGTPLAPGARLPTAQEPSKVRTVASPDFLRCTETSVATRGRCELTAGHEGFCITAHGFEWDATWPNTSTPVREPKPGAVTAICGRVLVLHGIHPDVVCSRPPGHDGECGGSLWGGRRL
jgi:hypothetical protein